MTSPKVTLMAVALITVCVLATNTHGVYIPCCRRYIQGKIKFQDIRGFSVQKYTELCPISAIIFHTKTGKKCANPALEWVINYVGRIELMAEKVHRKAQETK